MLFSSNVLNEPIREEDDSVVLALCKVGTLAQDEHGNVYELTENALQSDAPTWTGGKIRVNHDTDESGTISEAWYEAPYVFGRLAGLSEDARAVMSSSAYRGVSQESLPVEIKGSRLIKDHDVKQIHRVKGTGVSIMVYPYKPACPISAGCGVPIKSSEPDVFNSPLNTESPKIDTEPLGGPSMDENIIPNFEELMKENTELKAKVDELSKQVAENPAQVEAAVKAALASHEIKMKEEKEIEAIQGELKSCMPEGFEEFIATSPSKATMQATIKALRSANPIGAPAGVKSSMPEVFSSGKDIYAKLGLTPEDVAKVNGGI